MTTGWRKCIVQRDASLLEAMRVIDSSAPYQIALVAADDDRLLGTVTDGDIRRAILDGSPLETEVEGIMKREPVVANESADAEELRTLMNQRQVKQVPIIDDDGKVVRVAVVGELLAPTKKLDNAVVLMAGGRGERLRPLTENVPKPMLGVGGRPILETIITRFAQQGFGRFFLSVNYRAEIIEGHFGDGSRWGVRIEYLHETDRLGTAGAIGLLPAAPERPFIVMNGDLLTRLDFRELVAFHEEHAADATICVREYGVDIPYGVVKTEGKRLVGIDEKPVHKFFINAGVYVLAPSAHELVPENEHFDMTDLVQKLIDGGHTAVTFPVRDYWMDIGRVDDYARANVEFSEVFE